MLRMFTFVVFCASLGWNGSGCGCPSRRVIAWDVCEAGVCVQPTSMQLLSSRHSLVSVASLFITEHLRQIFILQSIQLYCPRNKHVSLFSPPPPTTCMSHRSYRRPSTNTDTSREKKEIDYYYMTRSKAMTMRAHSCRDHPPCYQQ
ncbi:hypothetical protein V8C26DRAFT_167270 [Trichoderma gracile]